MVLFALSQLDFRVNMKLQSMVEFQQQETIRLTNLANSGELSNMDFDWMNQTINVDRFNGLNKLEDFKNTVSANFRNKWNNGLRNIMDKRSSSSEIKDLTPTEDSS